MYSINRKIKGEYKKCQINQGLDRGGVQSDIDALKVKSASYSGQTAPTGSLLLQSPWNGRIPIFVTSTQAYRCLFFTYNNNLYIQCYTTNSANTQVIPVSGVVVSGTYYYVEM